MHIDIRHRWLEREHLTACQDEHYRLTKVFLKIMTLSIVSSYLGLP